MHAGAFPVSYGACHWIVEPEYPGSVNWKVKVMSMSPSAEEGMLYIMPNPVMVIAFSVESAQVAVPSDIAARVKVMTS